MTSVTDNTERNRFELRENYALSFADYRRAGGTLEILHVETDPALRGSGAAGRLMEGIAELAREQGLQIRPVCSYAVAWMQRHPEAEARS